MSSLRKRGRKPQQQRLTFEAVADSTGGSSGVGLSPARVRLSSPGGNNQASTSSPSKSLSVKFSPAAKMGARGRGKGRGRQQTLEASLGQERVKGSPKKQASVRGDEDDELISLSIGKDVNQCRRAVPASPRSSFMKAKKRVRRVPVQDSDSETPVEEDGAVSDSSGEGPLKQETPRQTRTKQVVSIPSDSDDDKTISSGDGENEGEQASNSRSSQSLSNQTAADVDSDDEPLVTPRSSMPRRRGRQAITLDDDGDEEEDEDEDENLQTPVKRRKVAKNRTTLIQSESSGEESDTALAKFKGKSTSKKRGSSPHASTARSMRSTVQKGHRSEKEKKMELLRRRRAGEKDLTMEDLTSSEDGDEGGLYDTDEEHQVLEVFDDESQSEEGPPAKKQSKKKASMKRQTARQFTPPDEDANSEDEDFIDDDDDTLGVPDEALHLIPLEFTRASRKPLKDHFRDAVEWLVHRKINPGFDRDNEVYVTAWRRLSDEVTGLANSKFISSVWRPDFSKSLKARPYIEQLELGPGHLAVEMEHCQACGRSGHPATWSIQFRGKPYDPKTLDEVESDSEDEDSEEGVDRGYDGSLIPPEDKQFFVGQTCNSNAETAHSLTHWKPSLRDWVEARLEGEGWMAPARIVEREKMKPRRRERVANEIVEAWAEGDIVKNLFLDFKATIESARTKDTTKVSRGARQY